jgi:CheY-like chemotaxis protein
VIRLTPARATPTDGRLAQTILVIDDSVLIRALASRILAEAGFVPMSAASGPQALALLDSYVFDLVIVDFVMPGMWGDEFIRRLRRHENPAVRATPVLGLSGSHKDAEALFAKAGATACLPKPLHYDPLLAAVRRLLRERSQPPG